MRFAGHMKMGFFPTPPTVTARVRRLVRFPEDDAAFPALDPCAGEGVALASFVEGANTVTYGIELDRVRAERAKKRLNHVLMADFFRCRIAPKSVSLLWLNPPYADDEEGRTEALFLKSGLATLRPGGVLVYIIQQHRLTDRIARVLNGHFEDVRIWRFPDPEFDEYEQVVVMGVRRAAAVNEEVPEFLLDARWTPQPPLSARAKAVYDIPPSPPLREFRSNEIDREALAKELAASKLGQIEVGRQDVGRDRPPVPLHAGHVALLLAAGELDGVVGRGRGRHLVRGYVKKLTDATTDTDEDGNETTHETERFEVQIKTLTQDGEVRVLSGA